LTLRRSVRASGARIGTVTGETAHTGFDTSADMGRVTEDVVWAKLAALSAGARLF